MVCLGLWKGLSTAESLELGFELRQLGDFADWQAANTRQMWWNWTSANQKIANYILEFPVAP